MVIVGDGMNFRREIAVTALETGNFTKGPLCPLCRGSSHTRTMEDGDLRAVDALIAANPRTGPCAARKCSNPRCGHNFIEVAAWRDTRRPEKG